jgi:hypothetical protein
MGARVNLLPDLLPPEPGVAPRWVAGWAPGSQRCSRLGSTLETREFGVPTTESAFWVAGVATYSKTFYIEKFFDKRGSGERKAYRDNNRDNLLHLLPRPVVESVC